MSGPATHSSTTQEIATQFQESLPSGLPSFVRPLSAYNVGKTRAHSCMLLLPLEFANDRLPKENAEIELVDEEDVTYKTNYLAPRHALHGSGWNDFVDKHYLNEGDALVFEELIEERKFKVYIIKSISPNETTEYIIKSISPNETTEGAPSGISNSVPSQMEGVPDRQLTLGPEVAQYNELEITPAGKSLRKALQQWQGLAGGSEDQKTPTNHDGENSEPAKSDHRKTEAQVKNDGPKTVGSLERFVKDTARKLPLNSRRNGNHNYMGFEDSGRKYNGYSDYMRPGRGAARRLMLESSDRPNARNRNRQMSSWGGIESTSAQSKNKMDSKTEWGAASFGVGPTVRSVSQALKDEATLKAIGVAGGGDNNSDGPAAPGMRVEAICNIYTGVFETALGVPDALLHVMCMREMGPVIDRVSSEMGVKLLHVVAKFLPDREFSKVCLEWLQNV